MQPGNGEVTLLLEQLKAGVSSAQERLIPIVYGELRRLAAAHMRRERPEHTLQPTALVHEAYLRLIGQENVAWQNRTHFFGVAAQIMRRILIDHARAHEAGKRGGGGARVPLDEALLSDDQAQEFLDLDRAMQRLALIDERQARIVELRFFGGLSLEETAETLGVTPRTVNRDWQVAQAWLRRELGRLNV